MSTKENKAKYTVKPNLCFVYVERNDATTINKHI